MDKYELTMGYSELTNRIYAVIKNKKGQIVKKKDVTDWVFDTAMMILNEREKDENESKS